MRTKTMEDPPVQDDRRRRPGAPDTDQPRSFDASEIFPDANADTSPISDADDDINTHGSER